MPIQASQMLCIDQLGTNAASITSRKRNTLKSTDSCFLIALSNASIHHLATVTGNRLKNTQSFSVNFFTCGEIPAGAGSCSGPLPLTEMAWNRGHYLVCSSLLCYERDLDSRTLSCTRTSTNTRFCHRKTASPKQRHLAGKQINLYFKTLLGDNSEANPALAVNTSKLKFRLT